MVHSVLKIAREPEFAVFGAISEMWTNYYQIWGTSMGLSVTYYDLNWCDLIWFDSVQRILVDLIVAGWMYFFLEERTRKSNWWMRELMT